jgi:hypothetical protein
MVGGLADCLCDKIGVQFRDELKSRENWQGGCREEDQELLDQD